MKKLQEINPNTGEYWNNRYKGTENRKLYEAETGTSRFYRALEEIKNGDKILDIGCGIGSFCSMVKGVNEQSEVWGVDISEEAIYANKIDAPQCKFYCNVVGELKDIPKEYFDVVFSGETLEHLDDPSQLFKDAYSVLKNGGLFILTTPDRNAVTSPEHMWSYDHDDINALYKEHGFGRVRFVYLPNGEHLIIIFAMGRKI